eukprot:TRINITY_DN179_c0_g1_i1.p1 TRINITY_DN179_c0_g1~~TRINITY_DN179_c0_g1_i1.p1  ORF type:complete len:458 (-),score=108.45 TRINITY_DN179_c0_g1_i1:341-1666(-)
MCIRDSPCTLRCGINAEYMGKGKINKNSLKRRVCVCVRMSSSSFSSSISSLLVIVLCLAVPQQSLGWWEAGHMITAEIAKQDLLRSDPRIYSIAEQIVLFGGDLSLSFTHNFAATAVWADTIKMQNLNMWNEWHYIDLPINDDGLQMNFDKGEDDNLIWAIDHVMRVLNSTKTANKVTIEKAMMARLLLHFLGDIHQPLHASALFNSSLLNGDSGGNLYNISYRLDETHNISNLHSFWDDGAGGLPDYNKVPFNDSVLDEVRQFALTYMQEFPRTAFSNELATDDITAWARESYHHARDLVYGPLLKEGQLHAPDIDPEYQRQSFEFVKRQLALGGYRLANLLRKALKGQHLDEAPGQHSQEPTIIKHYLRRSRSRYVQKLNKTHALVRQCLHTVFYTHTHPPHTHCVSLHRNFDIFLSQSVNFKWMIGLCDEFTFQFLHF